MEKNPLISIICLCYNHEGYLLETLNSVINQTYNNIELIIVDDCSTDNSKHIIEKWLLEHPKAIFISNERNIGNTRSFNKALKISKGAFIIDLATDDVLLENCVEKQMALFNENNFKNLGIIYGNAELIDENGLNIGFYFEVDENKKTIQNIPTGQVYFEHLQKSNLKNSVAAIIKRDVFEKLQGYDENLAYEDFDFWLRATRIFDVDYIDTILVKKRILKNSLSAHFSKKNNSLAKRINNSVYIILRKAIKLNKSKHEDAAVLKRIHHEMASNLKNRYFGIVLRYVFLEIKVRVRISLNNYL